MIEKLKSYFEKLKMKITEKIKEIKMTKRGSAKDSMRIVCLYGAGMAIVTILLIAGWVYQWIESGEPDLQALISFFREYTSASVVAAVTFLSVFHVDKNRDGRPDAAELRAKEK